MTTQYTAPPLERQGIQGSPQSAAFQAQQQSNASQAALISSGGRKPKKACKGGAITLVQTSNPAGINTGNQVANTTKTYVGAAAAGSNDSLVAPAQPIKTASGGRRRRKSMRKQKKSYSRKSYSRKGRKRRTIKKR